MAGRPPGRSRRRRCRPKFLITFSLKDLAKVGEPGGLLEKSVIDALAPQYFRVNDWMCTAFGELFRQVRAPGPGRAAGADLPAGVRAASDRLGSLDPLDADCLENLGRDALGKAIFLETLGFDNARIMGGAPLEATLLEVAQKPPGACARGTQCWPGWPARG